MSETPEHPDSKQPGRDLVKVSAGLNIDLGLGDLISRVIGAPLGQAAGVLTDFLGQVRFELSLKLMERARRKVEEAGFDQEGLGPVDLTRLFPILEWGSIASDESMQDRWASLLANALTDPHGVPPSFAEILRQLEPVDARILDLMFEKAGRPPFELSEHGGGSGWPPRVIEHYADLAEGTVTQARLENLVRLGVAFHPNTGATYGGEPTTTRDAVTLSALGAGFVRACRSPEPPSAS